MLRYLSLLLLLIAGGVVYLSRPEPPFSDRLARQGLACGYADLPCEVNGRTYNILVPAGDGPFPTLIFFHGSFGSGGQIVDSPHIAAPFLENGFAVIAPSALEVTYSGGRRGTGWIWEGQRDGRDDHQYVRDLIDDAAARFPIDTSRMMVAGHSNGATFIWYLACAGLDPRLRVYAPVGGTLVRDFPDDCAKPTRGFKLLHTHGRADDIVTLTDGMPRAGRWSGFLGVDDSMKVVATGAGCRERRALDADRTQWTGCRQNIGLWLVLSDGGHDIPVNWAEGVIAWAPSHF